MRALLRRGAEALPWLFVVLLLGLLGRTWLARVTYPYDLEWMEGGMLAHAWRLSRGEPLYVAPNPDFVPYIYPPGYSSVVALASWPVGMSPTVGRLLSLAGAFAAAGAIVWLLRQWRTPWGLSLASGMVFIGTYRWSGAFYDLVRPDGLYVAGLAWSVVLAASGRRGTPVAAGLLLAASFTMKHNAGAFGLPIALALLARGWRPALQFVAASAGPALALVALVQWRSGGLFLTYLLDVPQSHPSEPARFFPGTPLELGSALPFAAAAAVLWSVGRQAQRSRLPVPLTTGLPIVVGMLVAWYATRFPVPPGVQASPETGGPGVWAVATGAVVCVMAVLERPRRLPAEAWMAGAVVLTSVGLAAVMRAHNGGFLNVHIHMFWAVSLLFGMALARMPRPVAAMLVSAQLVWAAVGTRGRDLRPSEADRLAGDRMVELLRDHDGPVLAPFSAWLPTYAGHPPSLHYMGVWDLDYKAGPLRRELDVVRKAVRDGYWPVALDADQEFPYGLRKHYRKEGNRLVPDGPSLRPKTGWSARPEQLRVPK